MGKVTEPNGIYASFILDLSLRGKVKETNWQVGSF